IQNFFGECLIHLYRLAPNGGDRRSCARIRAGGHGSNVGGKQDEKTGGSGGRGGWAEGSWHRFFRAGKRRNDLPHRGIETARRAFGDQDEAGVLAISLVDAVDNVFGKHRLNFVVDTQLYHVLGST